MNISISGQHDFPVDLPSGAAVVIAMASGDEYTQSLSDHAPIDHLHLAMDDTCFEDEGFQYPQHHHITRLCRFLDSTNPEHLHVACYAGISRSAALAATALAYVHPELSDKAVLSKVLQVRPGCYPNALILSLADEELGCDLSGAAEKLFAGKGEGWWPVNRGDVG